MFLKIKNHKVFKIYLNIFLYFFIFLQRSKPGVGIRTKFLPLSDRRPSRGQKFLACPTESRAEPNCPIVRKSARLGSRALFRTNSDTGQPSSRDSLNTILGINNAALFINFFYFYLIIISVEQFLSL
jgi:hypothetical protein